MLARARAGTWLSSTGSRVEARDSCGGDTSSRAKAVGGGQSRGVLCGWGALWSVCERIRYRQAKSARSLQS